MGEGEPPPYWYFSSDQLQPLCLVESPPAHLALEMVTCKTPDSADMGKRTAQELMNSCIPTIG